MLFKLRTLSFILISLGGIIFVLNYLQIPQKNTRYTSIENAVTESAVPLASEVPQPTATPTLKLLFGGDMMFDRNIRKIAAKEGVDFALRELKPLLSSYDFVIANLEGPITDAPSKSLGSVVGSTQNYLFTFDPTVTTMLQQMNIRIVNLGNNHILNFGESGLLQTKAYLEGAGVKYFGNATANEAEERTLIIEKHDTKIAFVNYNEFGTDGFARALSDIRKVRSMADILIIYTHWGAEYQPIANTVIQTQAHHFIDAGVDAVIGSHPHVVQQYELYQGKHIYYSLGNFVFDQYFEDAVKNAQLVSFEIVDKKIVGTEVLPIRLDQSSQTLRAN